MSPAARFKNAIPQKLKQILAELHNAYYGYYVGPCKNLSFDTTRISVRYWPDKKRPDIRNNHPDVSGYTNRPDSKFTEYPNRPDAPVTRYQNSPDSPISGYQNRPNRNLPNIRTARKVLLPD